MCRAPIDLKPMIVYSKKPLMGHCSYPLRSYLLSMTFLLFVLLFVPGCMQKVQVIYLPDRVGSRQLESASLPIVAESSGADSAKKSDPSCQLWACTGGTDQLLEYFKSWQGVGYKYGGVSSKGVDCSGLTLRAYKELYGVNLPRTVVEQSKQGVRVEKSSLRPGDLVFFKTGRSARHVGIYLGENMFIHASRSKGVIQSSLNNVYWRTRYWQAKRLEPVRL